MKRTADFEESVHHSLSAILRYSFFAFAIYVIGTYFWWVGFICFLLFVIQLVGRLVLSGIVLFIGGLVIKVIRARGLHPTKFDAAAKATTGLLLIGATESLLILITVLLGASFFW